VVVVKPTKVFGDEGWVPTGVKAVVGTVEPGRSVQAQRAYVTAFFDQFLKGIRSDCW
jgi:hypothetical protein